VNDTKQQHQEHRRDEGHLDGRNSALIPQDCSTPFCSRLNMAVNRRISTAILSRPHPTRT
jgi:hypothetical protein